MIFSEINGSVLNLFFIFAATFAASYYTAMVKRRVWKDLIG